MARLRNVMVSYTKERFVIMLDSDEILAKEGALKMEEKLKNEGYSLTWMHYAYSEDELNKSLSPGEENPNLGYAGIDILALKKLVCSMRNTKEMKTCGYSKFKKEKFKVGPTEGRCLHLNKTHARLTLSDSLIEAKRNFWRSKYDMMLVLDGLTNVTFLSGYSYFGSYYIIGILSIFLPYFIWHIFRSYG
jgi:glycosyltransferase involved in cell wall biosynthesis